MFEAGGRAMLATGATVTSPNPIPKVPRHIPPPAVGTAHAQVSQTSVTLDTSNCFPDINRTPEKIDLGTLSLTAVASVQTIQGADAETSPIEIGTISFDQYNQAAYEATSGIIEIPLPNGVEASSLENMDLCLSASDGSIYMQETALRAIPTQPNLYMNQGQTITTSVQVYNRGQIAGSGINVTMAAIDGTAASAITQKTNANGVADFSLVGSTGSVTGYAFLPGDNPQLPVTSNNFNTQTETYMYVRVLPADADVAAKPPTWENVKKYVLNNWKAMAPCMDNWLDLTNEEQVKAYAKIIKKLTDPANFEDFRYMPVTRDLTPGQRTLLYNFLDGETLQSAIADDKTATESRMDFAQISKAMRGVTHGD
jgi:hypothetical protein